jgi:hypothetical protein
VRIVRLKSPRGPDVPPIYNALSIVDDRFVAYVHGRDLHLLDLTRGDGAPPILVVENGGNHAFVSDTLVTYDESHGFRRFVREGESFVEALRFFLPEQPAPWPTHLVLSPTGRFLCVELPPASGERHARVALFDALRGTMLACHPEHNSARASFTRLDGAEVLFLSAPSYMGVLLIDAESGRTLQSFEPSSGWDFCHTDYELSEDGQRLLVFGCIWAAPYEVRLYDATPWTRSAAPMQDGFPLRLLYRQNEDLGHETILPSRFFPSNNRTIDVLSLVSVRDLQGMLPEDARDLEEGLSPMNLEILAAARGLDASHALLVRRVDTESGNLVSFHLAPTASTHEGHVHMLPEHRAILVNDRIQSFDGETVQNVADFDKPAGWYQTAVTRNGDTLVVREVAKA